MIRNKAKATKPARPRHKAASRKRKPAGKKAAASRRKSAMPRKRRAAARPRQAETKKSLIDQLVKAGQRAAQAERESDWEILDLVLEFMDSIWDRMPHAERERAEKALRQAGPADLAHRVADEKKRL